jgi:hypothetical protein
MLNVPISDQLLPFIQEQAASAGFTTLSDYVQHLILQEQRRVESLQMSEVEKNTAVQASDPIALMRLPLEERRKALELQAATMVQHYQQDEDWRTFTAGDIIEY